VKFVAVFICALLHAALLSGQSVAQPASPYPFELRLTTPDSTELPSAEALPLGKPTVLAFWLTTCTPCMNELAAYTRHYAEWKARADFNLIAVSLDFPERFRKVKPLVAEQKWPFPVYWDRVRAFKSLLPGGLNGVPQVFLFDRDGRLVWQHKGYRTGAEQEMFQQVLGLH
jgi:peroxiredoxin